MSIRYGGHPIDMRVAVLPTTHGEQIVLRILNRPGRPARAERARDEPRRRGALRARDPAAVRRRAAPSARRDPARRRRSTPRSTSSTRPSASLMTIEDPVEYQMPGVNQIEVNFKSGLTFARGLRTILRSDPDVLLVGEIRDEETARIAIQAAMTGHLVLTTLHTHNAAVVDRAARRHGRRAEPARHVDQLHRRAAARPPALRGLPRGVLADRRGARGARPGRAERGPCGSTAPSGACTAAAPGSRAASRCTR